MKIIEINIILIISILVSILGNKRCANKTQGFRCIMTIFYCFFKLLFQVRINAALALGTIKTHEGYCDLIIKV